MSRVIVEDAIYDEFMDGLIKRTRNLKIGDDSDPDVEVSPLASKSQFDTVTGYIEVGTKEGAKIACGGNSLSGGIFDEGYYVEPTIFTEVSTSMRIAQEEIFGPVLTIFKATDLAEAIDISNNVKFGLSSSVYTKDLTRAFQYVSTAQAGMVHTTVQPSEARCICHSED